MKKAILICSLLYCSFSVIGCASDPSSGSSTNTLQSIFPLKTGNIWHHKLINYTNTGEVRDSTLYDMVVDSTIINGSDTAYYMTLNDLHGIFYKTGNRLLQKDQLDGPGVLWTQYPMTVGEVIVVTDSVIPNVVHYRVEFKLVAENVSVTTPAGTFNTIHYQKTTFSSYNNNPLTIQTVDDYYYAIGVGLVKVTEVVPNGSGMLIKAQDDVVLAYELK